MLARTRTNHFLRATQPALDITVPTGQFSKTLKQSVAGRQVASKYPHLWDSPAKWRALEKVAATGTGGLGQIDNSHHVSAKYAEHIGNMSLKHPGKVSPAFIRTLKAVHRRGQYESSSARESVAQMIAEIESNRSRTTRVPVTREPIYERGFRALVNKNESNLRYRASSENRATSDFPHPEFTKRRGVLTRDSATLARFAAVSGELFKDNFKTHRQKRLAAAYRAVPQGHSSLQKTEDAPEFRKRF